MYQVFVKSPDGDEIELVSAADPKVAEGAHTGAQALLNLLYDEMDLDEGFEIILKRESDSARLQG